MLFQKTILPEKTKFILFEDSDIMIVMKVLYLENWLHAWMHSLNPSNDTLLETKFWVQQRITNFRSIDSCTGYGLKFFSTTGGITKQQSRNA